MSILNTLAFQPKWENVIELPPPRKPDAARAPLRNAERVRFPAIGSQGSQSGAIVDPRDRTVILTESGGEHNLLSTCIADPNVVRVRDQYLKLWYTDAEGVRRHHTLDFVVDLKSGISTAYIHKHEDSAVEHDLRSLVRMLSEQTSRSIIHQLQPVTPRHLQEWHMANARLLKAVQHDRRTQVDNNLLALAPTLTHPMPISEVLCRLDVGGRDGFRPIARALYFGTLDFRGTGRIDMSSLVVFSGTVMEDPGRDGPIIDVTLSEPPVIQRRATPKSTKRRASFRNK